MESKRPPPRQTKTSSNGPTDPQEKIRLSKLMTERGICSRREADDFISKGLVFVNGERIQELGFKVSRDVEVELAGRAQEKQSELVTIILNKPIGFVSAQPEPPYLPAIKLLTRENFFSNSVQPTEIRQEPTSLRGLAVAGRLDIDSQGLLIFTQDGRVAKKIIGEESEIEKEYLVRVSGSLSRDQMKLLNHGLEMDGKALKEALVEWVNEDQLRFVLTEGKKRQVRRMCEMMGLEVRGLKRVRVGKLMLGKLPEGRWRYLGAGDEI